MQDDPLARFSLPVRTWFSRRFSAPTDPQRAGWPAIASGTHTLITAPTGSGKTLAAFLFSLDHLVQLGERGVLTDAVHVLYVSPLKALNNDIARNLAEPLAGIREAARELGVALPELRAAVRTGDTPAPDRTAMARRPPHILITTPESLFILLASERWQAALATVRYLIVDEIHAVAGSKRGVHLSLSLERLAALAETPPLRIGLSATVEPVEEIAHFLVGVEEPEGAPRPCRVVDVGRRRDLDLAVVAPLPELGAVATNPVWEATYARLAELILAHRTTLVFAGSRRLAERIAVRLTERLGPGMVAAHHGSLARRQRQEAEVRLKAGAIRAIVATGSLELGIDIGAIDLVCQIESPRALATAIQRIGRSGHWLGATPKGRLFALTRDDLLECAALVRAVREGRLDRIETPTNCLDVLAQQVVAAAADQEWEAEALYRLVRRSACYRDLPRGDFDAVLAMQADRLPTEPRGVAPRLYWDRLRSRIRGRRGARLAAVTSGGTIPDTTNYDVYLEPAGIKLGEVEEDFAQESMRGDIFTLGNASWRILRVQRGRMVVESAAGLPPTIPFWHGELPGRTVELSGEVSRLRRDLEARLDDPEAAAAWLAEVTALEPAAARIAVEYVSRQRATAGVVPTTETLLAERFFDALGGTQVVLHAPFGMRVTRAWGLALAKRICRSFNFEIQSAATDDAILLSLGVRHSFPLETIWRFLAPETVEETLIQALLAAPLFETRFRHAAVRALLILRQQGGRRVPAYLQRLRATDLLAACFPAQQACLDNRAADLDIPVADHPLVHETLRECLTEALDLGRLRAILEEIRTGAIRTVARELPVPSPFAHKILAAWDYAFLDDAPREERRSRTVQTHRGILGELAGQQALDGTLDPAAAGRVAAEVGHLAEGSRARDPDELVELLKEMGPLTAAEVAERADGEAGAWLETLAAEGRVIRAGRGAGEPVWIATEILPLCRAAYPGLETDVEVSLPAALAGEAWEPEAALRELARRRLRHAGPLAEGELAARLALPAEEVRQALVALEAEGALFRGRFVEGDADLRWCERTVLERIHRLTLERLRQEVEPVEPATFTEFLLRWQRVSPDARLHGTAGLETIVAQLQGVELPGAAIERDILPLRIADYRQDLLDQLTLTGTVVWGRLGLGASAEGSEPERRPLLPPPLALLRREDLDWLRPPLDPTAVEGLSGVARRVLEALGGRGASFMDELARATGLEAPALFEALWELARAGRVTNDSFAAVRLLASLEGRQGLLRARGEGASSRPALRLRARLRSLPGRWSLLPAGETDAEARLEAWTSQLLERYGVIFRELLALEPAAPPWRELAAELRRREYAGRLRRGLFLRGVSGEQYALPSAVELLREVRRAPREEFCVLSAADPALLYGPVFPPRIQRHPGTRVVLRGGRPLLALEGTRLLPLEAAEEEWLPALRALVEGRRERKLVIERWGEAPIRSAAAIDWLGDLGFHGDGERLVFDGFPGPRPRPDRPRSLLSAS